MKGNLRDIMKEKEVGGEDSDEVAEFLLNPTGACEEG